MYIKHIYVAYGFLMLGNERDPLHMSSSNEKGLFIPVRNASRLSFQNRTLILPTISVGSVPQLTLDLLIHAPALECSRVGFLDGSACAPFISPPEPGMSSEDVYTPLDVYNSPHGITIVQQRSPVLKVMRASFTERLMEWIKRAGFIDVLLVSSMDAAMRMDVEFSTPFLYTRPVKADDTPLSDTISRKYPRFCPAAFRGPGLPPMPGSGTARIYLEHAPKNFVALFMFCAEGDNRMDAQVYAEQIALACNVRVTSTYLEPPYGNLPQQHH